jgi:hypothetical protein
LRKEAVGLVSGRTTERCERDFLSLVLRVTNSNEIRDESILRQARDFTTQSIGENTFPEPFRGLPPESRIHSFAKCANEWGIQLADQKYLSHLSATVLDEYAEEAE